MRLYAIGDIHGQLEKLRQAHAWIASDRHRTSDRDAPVVHLGDLVDRGPDSAGVVAFLIAGPAGPERWITVKGNHDHMFTLFMQVPPAHDPGLRRDLSWLDGRLGGLSTLSSYGVDTAVGRTDADLHEEAVARVPAAHLSFLRGLPLWFRAEDTLCVHAGLRPGIPLEQQSGADLMWIRAPFLDDRRDHGPLVVHGHTPVERPEHHGNRLNLDTGAGYGGPLTAAVIEGSDVFALTADGRTPLTARDPA